MAQNVLAATSALPAVLVASHLAASQTTLYTVASASSVKVASASIANTSATAVTVTLNVCRTGTTASAANQILPAVSVAAGQTVSLQELLGGAVLGPGDFLSGFASAASAVTLVVTGTVWS